jgi:hypothetical protein
MCRQLRPELHGELKSQISAVCRRSGSAEQRGMPRRPRRFPIDRSTGKRRLRRFSPMRHRCRGSKNDRGIPARTVRRQVERDSNVCNRPIEGILSPCFK